jgi:hypothetical protein
LLEHPSELWEQARRRSNSSAHSGLPSFPSSSFNPRAHLSFLSLSRAQRYDLHPRRLCYEYDSRLSRTSPLSFSKFGDAPNGRVTGVDCALPLDGSQLDTLKNRMQTSRATSRPKIHTTIAEVFREEGVRGFYRGCLIPVASISVTSELCHLLVFDLCRPCRRLISSGGGKQLI